MRISYEFITGEKFEIEVDENIGEVIIEMEKMKSRRNRAETRRHNSLEFMQENRDRYRPMQFADNRLRGKPGIVKLKGISRYYIATGRCLILFVGR